MISERSSNDTSVQVTFDTGMRDCENAPIWRGKPAFDGFRGGTPLYFEVFPRYLIPRGSFPESGGSWREVPHADWAPSVGPKHLYFIISYSSA